MHFDLLQVLYRRQIYDSVLFKELNEALIIFSLMKIHLLLVSILMAVFVDVVAQFTLISLPMTRRLFIASRACAAA